MNSSRCLDCYSDCIGDRQLTVLFETASNCVANNRLHYEEPPVLRNGGEIMHDANISVANAGGQLSFPLYSRYFRRIAEGLDHLDGNIPAELNIVGEVNRRSAAAEATAQAVPVEEQAAD